MIAPIASTTSSIVVTGGIGASVGGVVGMGESMNGSPRSYGITLAVTGVNA